MCKMLSCEFYLNYLMMVSQPAHHRPSAHSGATKVHDSTTTYSLSLFPSPSPHCFSWPFPKLKDRAHFSPPSRLALNFCPFFHWPLPAGLIFPRLPCPCPCSHPCHCPQAGLGAWPLRPCVCSPALLRSGPQPELRPGEKKAWFVQPGERAAGFTQGWARLYFSKLEFIYWFCVPGARREKGPTS